MAVELNVTYITLGGHVEVNTYRYLYFVIMLTAYILIICFNSTIVCLIRIHRNLHEPMYIFIAALLINSLLFSSAIYPKLLLDFLSEKQITSYSACLFQIFLFYTFTCSEFLLLSAMAYDRYVSICKPLQYPTIMRKNKVTVILLLSWFVPACQLAVAILLVVNSKLCRFVLKGIYCNNSVNYLYCERPRTLTVYGLVVLVNLALVPMVFIMFTYSKILIIVYRSSGEVRRKAAQTCLPHLLVLINYSFLITYDIIIVRTETNFPRTVRFVMTLQMVTCNPLFNPVIYGLKVREISKQLIRLFSGAKAKTGSL